MVKDSLVIGVMKDIPPPPQKIRIETPIGINIETPDDSPLLDGLIITLGFFAFCFYVYARYLKSK